MMQVSPPDWGLQAQRRKARAQATRRERAFCIALTLTLPLVCWLLARAGDVLFVLVMEAPHSSSEAVVQQGNSHGG